MNDPKPCPFCGAKVMRVECNAATYPFIVCENNHAWCLRLETESEAIAAWNERAESAGYCQSKYDEGGCIWTMD